MKRALSASVPNASSVLAQRLCTSWPAPGAPARRNSSTTTSAVSPSRPARPYHSAGHVGAAQPASTTSSSQSWRGSAGSQCPAS